MNKESNLLKDLLKHSIFVSITFGIIFYIVSMIGIAYFVTSLNKAIVINIYKDTTIRKLYYPQNPNKELGSSEKDLSKLTDSTISEKDFGWSPYIDSTIVPDKFLNKSSYREIDCKDPECNMCHPKTYMDSIKAWYNYGT